MIPERFTYPFCYTPHPEIVAAASRLIARIDGDPQLHALFAEGKMMGVLMVQLQDGSVEYLYGFSGIAGGMSQVQGFVPPIFDQQDPKGHFKLTEARISELTAQINALRSSAAPLEQIAELKARRREMSVDLQEWLFEQYMVSNALGERMSIAEVFASKGIVPPGGTGECAAPKLIQYAYGHGMKPLAMGEFWYGASPRHEIRHQGCFYPSCTGKCGPLLEYMLRGLDVEPNPLTAEVGAKVEIIYRDAQLVIADKPSGMLSVPGRTGQRSLQEVLGESLGCELYACHRLDMDTSGIIVFGLTPAIQAEMQKQFASRSVEKSYMAILGPGTTESRELKAGDKGRITLPIAADWYDRPRQMVSGQGGKDAVTDYEVLELLQDGRTLVRFVPHTGRTHQLRVHAAHPQGLGRPIVGDRLYGTQSSGAELKLRADRITFTHPASGKRMSFETDNKNFI